MYLTKPFTFLTNATGTGLGTEVHDSDWRVADKHRDAITLLLSGTYTGLHLQPVVSDDGETWYPIGSALTPSDEATIAYSITGILAPHFNVDVTAITGGHVTVKGV